jgi:protein TonB
MTRLRLAALAAVSLIAASCGSWTGDAEPDVPPRPPPPPAAPPPPPAASAAPSAPPPAPPAPPKAGTGGWFDEDPPAGAEVGAAGGATAAGVTLVPFVEGMSRPQRISGSVPGYTQKAIDANVEGKMLIKCVILTTGETRDCRVVQSLPHLDQAVLEALKSWRFKPAQKDGKPVAIEYVLPFTFKLPSQPAQRQPPSPPPPGARTL